MTVPVQPNDTGQQHINLRVVLGGISGPFLQRYDSGQATKRKLAQRTENARVVSRNWNSISNTPGGIMLEGLCWRRMAE